MIFFWIILSIAVIYCFLVYVASRFMVPFMGFGKWQEPENIPKEIQNQIVALESESSDARSYLEGIYKLVLDKTVNQWNHTRFRAAVNLPRAFVTDLDEIWQTKNFLYCTAINYLLFVMLVKSKFFNLADVRVKHVFVNFFIHQYLQIRINDRWIDVDPAGNGIRGKPLGSHLSFFG